MTSESPEMASMAPEVLALVNNGRDFRSAAIEVYDARCGYSVEFACDPGHHRAKWDELEQAATRLRTALNATDKIKGAL